MLAVGLGNGLQYALQQAFPAMLPPSIPSDFHSVIPSQINTLYLDSAGTTAASVDGLVGRANDWNTTGAINATQATTGNKPTLRRGAVNLLLQSQTFDSASWTPSGVVITPNVTIAPDGTSTADLIAPTVGTTGFRELQQNFTSVTGLTYCYSGHFKEKEFRYIQLVGTSANFGSFYVNFDLNTGTETAFSTTGSTVVSRGIVSAGNGFYRVWVAVVCSTGGASSRLAFNVISSATDIRGFSFAANGTDALYGWGAQLELGSTASDYTPTTTAAASSSSGPMYMQFDGTTDYLSLSAVPFQMADDHWVVVCARNDSSAATSKVLFSLYGTTTRRVAQLSFETTTLTATWTDDAGTAGTSPTGSVVSVGTTIVATARKIGNVKELRKNGVLVNSSGTAAGATTITNGVIGANTANFAQGTIYAVIYGKGTISDADLAAVERYAGSLGGLSI